MSGFTKRFLPWTIAIVLCLLPITALSAQDQPDAFGEPLRQVPSKSHSGSSPFDPPEKTDATFFVDSAGGLDTGCTFRSGGPLVFSIKVDRVVGDVAKLKQNGLISETASLQMPAYDVDFDASFPGVNPERDRVTFNGHVVPGEYLTGSNGIWKLNTFNVPIDWVNFASDPGPGGQAQEVDNTIRIFIDVANSEEYWCTAIDWASLEIKVVRPVVMAHGILSDGGVWDPIWVPQLNNLGILTDNDLNMGNLDSIGNNAAKIGTVVERAKKRWGVERVNIVCHSKGGLDSRHYAENDDSVDRLVQLGTPNAGSPLADVVEAGSVILFGLGGSAIINALAGPAGVQLTTPYMSLYNSNHGSNPKVQYTALAGDYHPPSCPWYNPFCGQPERLLLGITGPGDTIVPITSVHALPYTSNRTFVSSGSNKEATHTSLEKSLAVYNATSDRVRQFGRPKASLGPSLARTATVGGEIALGETKSHSVPVDEGGEVSFSMLYAYGDLELELVTPSGERITPASAAGDPDVEYGAGDILGGRMASFGLVNAEAGVWTVEVSVLSLAEPSTGYAVNAWFEDPAVTFSGSLTETLPAGSAISLFGTVRENGAPLSGATVVARLIDPDGTATDVTLADDGTGPDTTAGDGIYSGTFSGTSTSGLYRVAFTASGTTGTGAPFSREDFGLAAVSASSSSFAGTFRDYGRDTDGDGFYNELVVEADLNLTLGGDYRVFGVLADSMGNTYEARVTENLAAGPATVELAFDGEAIFQNRVDGPYTLSRVVLIEEDDFDVLPVDELTDAHQSAAYSYLDFQHGPIELTGEGSAVGIDYNSNGLYDVLQVGVGVEVRYSSYYQWSAQLVDSNGTEIGFATGGGYLYSGINTMTFYYNGTAIGENGVDGPYTVTSLLVFASSIGLAANNVYETPAFLASEFEGYTFDSTPPEVEVTVDPSVLWPPSHQMVDIAVTLSVTDDIDPNPQVRLVSIVSSEDDNATGDGNTTGDIQGASYGTDDRAFQLRAERSGTGVDRVYTILYEAEDASGNVGEGSATVTVPHDRSGQ